MGKKRRAEQQSCCPTQKRSNWIDIGNVAWRFGVDEQEVVEKVEVVEGDVKLKMTKVLKDKHLLSYVRALHDREAEAAPCPQCQRVGFDDWLHFGAHLRTHVLDEMLRGDVDAKQAAVALQALRDTDKMMVPVEKIQAEIEIPGGRENLLQTLGAALGQRQLAQKNTHNRVQDTATPTESPSPDPQSTSD